MTKRLLILTEGPTEQAFVRDVLAGHLAKIEISAAATCIETRFDRSKGRSYRGGHGHHYGHIRRHLLRLLGENSHAHVTTMLDLYGLPPDFPGLPMPAGGDCFQRCASLETAFAADIANPRFIANLVLHEFEGLLFTSPEKIEYMLESGRLQELQAIAASVPSPEEINDSPESAPSKRLERLFPGYSFDKPRYGALIAESIGLAALRSKCKHFDDWIFRLERL